MYLSQHFLIDVYFGSVIGVASAVTIIYLIGRSGKLWLDKSIMVILSNTNEKKH
jgi:membrane-associated phospholipid phosphatase